MKKSKNESALWLEIAGRLQSLSDLCQEMHNVVTIRERADEEESNRRREEYLDQKERDTR